MEKFEGGGGEKLSISFTVYAPGKQGHKESWVTTYAFAKLKSVGKLRTVHTRDLRTNSSLTSQ